MSVYLNAAYQILKEEKRAMSQEELTRIAIERDLIAPKGSTPWQTMGSLIYVDIKKYGLGSRFNKVGPNLFALNEDIDKFSIPKKHRRLRQKSPRRAMRSEKRRTFLDAAFEVLEQEGRPLNHHEITRLALDRDLLTTSGKTPEQTMSARLYGEINAHGDESTFILVEPQTFFFRDNKLGLSHIPVGSGKRKKKKRTTRTDGAETKSDVYRMFDQTLSKIHQFLQGRSNFRPTDEVLCEWVYLCYTVGLYYEGNELFKYVNEQDINAWAYKKAKRYATACRSRFSG